MARQLHTLLLLLLPFASHSLSSQPQVPLATDAEQQQSHASNGLRHLRGRFLHITDFHPDPFYKAYSATDEDAACHRQKGSAGAYGAETSDCDSPFSLVDATFDWIDQNIKDSIDFVIWTGDSARHDNDEKFPRSVKQVLHQNRYLVERFHDVFGAHGGQSPHRFATPIIPTVGNNDILPHNIFSKGPNKWTKEYIQLWKYMVPEEQRHQFERGGWFYVEVIPQKLAVFSLNTMYFFTSNSAVDGCASASEPGYEQFEWLRIQLQFLRERGMKAIMSGHVPPARTEDKDIWDETCWQKYALWMQQYRDVVIGSMYGHMNIDHFMIQDFEEIDLSTMQHSSLGPRTPKEAGRSREDVVGPLSESDYLTSLRDLWSSIPSAPKDSQPHDTGDNHGHAERKFYKKIGGEWAERYSVSYVSPSVVPNYYPTMRIFEYNMTDLESSNRTALGNPSSNPPCTAKKKENKKKKKKRPRFTVPDGPPKTSAPGPAYSPQTLSLVGYTQYYANLTYINNDFDIDDGELDETKWRHGKYQGKKPKKPSPQPREFKYQVEYDTRSQQDSFGLQKGLTVRNMIELASRISNGSRKSAVPGTAGDVAAEKQKKKKKHRKKKRVRYCNRIWNAFVERALVSTTDADDLFDRPG